MLKETTLVSVIVPVYNMQPYLVECISSILASDYPAFEVIIMDDGSTDHSLAIARKFEKKDPRVKVFSQN
ncbi:MAG: glycosyltransferase family 2 protein, partial [Bacteroidales bacterium]|nr:glycosyltransferase family 2 protein [Bacteroidales bacterium]